MSSDHKATVQRELDTVHLQLDYFMSSQFAGVAVAIQQGLYTGQGLDVRLLPECPPGLEPQAVLAVQAQHPADLCVGTIEQNVLAPYCASDEGKQGASVVAVGAMLGRSPLCLAALPVAGVEGIRAPDGRRTIVGAHEDTVELLQRLMPEADVRNVPRECKLAQLRDGTIDAVQVYDVAETITLERELRSAQQDGNSTLRVVSFDDLSTEEGGVQLGYAQVVFAQRDVVENQQRDVMARFMAATFEGWRRAIADPACAAQDVLALQPSGIDHFLSTPDFVCESVRRCCAYVKRTRAGDKLGVIDPGQWARANDWLAPSGDDTRARLDTTLWAVDQRLMLGSRLAQAMQSTTRATAADATAKLGRRPHLCVVMIGDVPLGAGHEDAQMRLELLGIPDSSWFDKGAAGESLGIDVTELFLPSDSTTTESAIAQLKEMQHRGTVDGIQIMWPFPSHIDPVAVISAVGADVDADGALWRGQMELAGSYGAAVRGRELLRNAPVTAAAVLHLLDYHNVEIAGRRVHIIGRSKLCGSPLAFMFGVRGGLVTMSHSQTPLEQLEAACREADIVIPCVGQPSIIPSGAWIKPGAVVVNVGTTFIDGQLVPDIPELSQLQHAALVASCPNGVGPLSVAVLMESVAKNALGRTPKPIGAVDATPLLSESELAAWLEAAGGSGGAWAQRAAADGVPPALTREYHVANYPAAIDFVARAAELAEKANHHPNIQIRHSCTAGVDVTAEFFTYAVRGITEFDTQAAEALDHCYGH
jgi:methylenetetrahydrofolate dehydrogenase (NADP+)/methenyltetrahydrofolate cyclohydrolase